jgi:hypothetical protein
VKNTLFVDIAGHAKTGSEGDQLCVSPTSLPRPFVENANCGVFPGHHHATYEPMAA